MAAHRRTLHGGVGLTMAAIRSRYSIPRLRQLAKRMIKRCYGCKQFQAVAHAHPPVGNLPKDRTEGSVPFQVIGVDFAGPIAYQKVTKMERHTSFCSHVVLQERFIWSYYQTRQWRHSFEA